MTDRKFIEAFCEYEKIIPISLTAAYLMIMHGVGSNIGGGVEV